MKKVKPKFVNTNEPIIRGGVDLTWFVIMFIIAFVVAGVLHFIKG